MIIKHTPGPWRIGTLQSFDGYTGQPFRNVWAGHNDTATVVARAIRSEGAMTNDVDLDALLIAAAPDLLDALIWARDGGEGWRELANAAIEKAIGKSSTPVNDTVKLHRAGSFGGAA